MIESISLILIGFGIGFVTYGLATATMAADDPFRHAPDPQPRPPFPANFAEAKRLRGQRATAAIVADQICKELIETGNLSLGRKGTKILRSMVDEIEKLDKAIAVAEGWLPKEDGR